MIANIFTAKSKISTLEAENKQKTFEIVEKTQQLSDLNQREDALLAIKSAMDNTSSAIMMIDRDFIVTYVNEATIKLFTENASEFKTAYPNFDTSKIMGTCIDVFHKNPAHQRKMLAETSRLPFKTDIKVGSLTVALYVTATHDKNGKHTGNVLEWRDVTAERRKSLEDAEAAGQIKAINKIQGVIEFDLLGNVISVNENFLGYVGYSAKEMVGQHHSMLVDSAVKNSPEYKTLWEKLGRGEADMGLYKNLSKSGKDVWVQGSYNPIMDNNGKLFRIMKYATNVTADIEKELENTRKAAFAMQIKSTLEAASINMMMADNDGFIRYMNPSTEKFMQASASNFKKVLPNFDPNKIIDQNFDIFHKNPAHQRNLLSSLTGPYSVTLPLGDLFVKLSANPIYDEGKNRIGSVLEWLDVTLEKHAEMQMGAIIESAVAGDVRERLNPAGKNEATAKTMVGINTLLDKLTEVVSQVRDAGETINTAASEIATGNNDLSNRTEQQASSLEETASSMEELASTVKQNAENAKQANQLAVAASGVAIKGGEVVGQVVNTMSAINSSAKKIEDIISVIDGIAFQTNILALNAAVEAARAGEQGRGFAVVAGEVRNLAQRSATAAKEIKELIVDSVNKTAEGTSQVEKAGETMQEIVSSVQRVTDIMGEITAASQEQSSGIDQVNNAITSMDEVTQQNAALVEEAAAAAESLVEQAANLMDTVGAFKLAGIQTYSKHTKTALSPAGVKQERRASNSPMRTSAPAIKVFIDSSPKVTAKSGTDDGDWEEF